MSDMLIITQTAAASPLNDPGRITIIIVNVPRIFPPLLASLYYDGRYTNKKMHVHQQQHRPSTELKRHAAKDAAVRVWLQICRHHIDTPKRNGRSSSTGTSADNVPENEEEVVEEVEEECEILLANLSTGWDINCLVCVCLLIKRCSMVIMTFVKCN